MRNIQITLSPYEVNRYIQFRGEAKSIIVHILRNWKLDQPAYEDILDEIPGYAIKQYLNAENNGNAEDAHKQTEVKTLRERLIEELKVLKADPLMQKAPTAIELVEDNYPEVVDYLSAEGMIAGLLLVLELLDKEENNNTK